MQLSKRDGADGRRESGASLSFSSLPDGPGVAVFDPIERHRCEVRTGEAISPEPATTEPFLFPVDAAIEFHASALEVPSTAVYVRDESGRVVAEAEHFAWESVPAGTYSVEFTTQVKLYLRVESAVTVATDFEGTRVEFDGETRVLLGARSRHDRPASSITVTEEPEDLLVAISYLGSALKTTSPERSYPTLRGHPPTFELGERLDVPSTLEKPDTGIRLELPADYEHAFVAAPLAYYLGADVVPAERPRLVTDDGFVHDLDGHRGFETEVERVLKQTFFMDCLVRTEGLYQVDLHERKAVEAELDLPFAELYDRPLAEQVATYLSVPYELLEAHVPEWKLTTHVSPRTDSIELLPFLVNDLAVIRTPRALETTGPAEQLAAVNDFLRDEDDFTRSASEATSAGPVTLQPETTDSLEQAWIGSGAPIGASKPTVESFRNRLDRTPADGDIDITVVCNDPEMAAERDVVTEVYSSREDLPFDVTIHHELTTTELCDLLSEDVDFLHYIGHIDDDGFQCADGKLSVLDLEDVGVDAFLLNACQSYEQGLGLIEAGAIGGVVTLRDVVNSGAVTIGRTLSRLLNRGFSLRAALNVASGESVIGSQYVVVGDGGFAVTQSESGNPLLFEVEKVGEDAFDLSIRVYPTSDRGMGSIIVPHVNGANNYFLNSGRIDAGTIDRQELSEFLSLEVLPLRYGGDLHWTDQLSESDF